MTTKIRTQRYRSVLLLIEQSHRPYSFFFLRGSRNTRGLHEIKIASHHNRGGFLFRLFGNSSNRRNAHFCRQSEWAFRSPPNTSPGIGAATVTFDTFAFTMNVNVAFQDLFTTFNMLPTGVTVAHIHCCTTTPNSGTAGVATTLPSFPLFPAGIDVHSGTYNTTFNMLLPSSYNPAFITANGGTTISAFAALLTGALEGREYLNIHSTAFPMGRDTWLPN